MIKCLIIILIFLIFLCFISYAGVLDYDNKIKPLIRQEGIDFDNDLKVEAQLNSDYEQGLMKMNTDRLSLEDEPKRKLQYKYSENNDKTCENDFGEETDKKYNFKSPEEYERKTCPSCETIGISDLEGLQGFPKHSFSSTRSPFSKVKYFFGSNLFDGIRKKCFSSEDYALLVARRAFEVLIPKSYPRCLLTDEMVGILMKYFCNGNDVIQHVDDAAAKRLVERAYYDTLGSYLKHILVPMTKISFYAGKVTLRTVEQVIELYEEIKSYLNTNGNGWLAPVTLNELDNLHVEPMEDPKPDDGLGCSKLNLKSSGRDVDEEHVIVPLPRLDSEDYYGYLNSIELPFKNKRSFNLQSPKSAFALAKFYETVANCYDFQNIRPNAFNKKFKTWLMENVEMHLSDDKFYPGFGSVLRIYEDLRRKKKELDTQSYEKNENSEDGEEEKEDEAVNETYDNERDENAVQLHNLDQSQDYTAEEDSDSDKSSWFEKVLSFHKDKPECESEIKNRRKCKPKKPCKKPVHKFYSYHHHEHSCIKYIIYTVALILFLLLMVLLCAFLSKRLGNKDNGDGNGGGNGGGTGDGGSSGGSNRKRKRDEEVLLQPDSTSVMPASSGQNTSRVSSSSSVVFHGKTKCIPFAKSRRKALKSDAQSTSGDVSSSEPDKRRKAKQKQKVVTINEKKNRQAKERKKPKADKSSKSNRSNSKSSPSWETTYES